jgi:alpha-ketoglutarate-dependent taurine dioxygenase
MKRKTVKFSQQSLVKTGYLDSAGTLPLVMEPAGEGVNLSDWIKTNGSLVQSELDKHGAILFRGFNIDSPERFQQVIRSISGEPLEYSERSSPRSQVSGNVYTSTDYPPNRTIFPHNEQSYNQTFIRKIFFCCLVPALEGGATPIANCRNIYKRIDPKIRQRFIDKKYMYVRNFGDGFGLSWQTTFQTEDRRVVDEYCRKNNIALEWKTGNRLRTRQVRRAEAKHPTTGESVWFNHLTFFHISTIDPDIREWMLDQFTIEDLPNNTYYGDGSSIEPSVLDELRGAYLEEKVIFPWQKGDVLAVDNMLTAHAREPFVGPRKVIVGMAEPFNWNDVE